MVLLFINSFIEFLDGNVSALRAKLIIECFLWLSVAVAIVLDLFSGIRKAKERQELRLSEGYRRTVDKVKQYYGMLVYAFLFDCLIMFVLSAFEVHAVKVIPFASIVCTGYLVFIEWRSYMEKASEKGKRAFKEDVSVLLTLLDKREDLIAGFIEVAKEKLKEDNNETN